MFRYILGFFVFIDWFIYFGKNSSQLDKPLDNIF